MNAVAIIARMMLTLDYLSEGRAFMGIGVGGTYPTEWEAAQSDLHNRGKRTDEALVMIKKLWTEESVDFQGEHYSASGAQVAPRPVQRPHPPLWVAGTSVETMQLAARWDMMPITTGLLGAGGVRSHLTSFVQALKAEGKDYHRQITSWEIDRYLTLF